MFFFYFTTNNKCFSDSMVSIDLFSIDLLWNMIVAKHVNVLLRPTWYNQTTRYDQKTWFLINDKWGPRKFVSLTWELYHPVFRKGNSETYSHDETKREQDKATAVFLLSLNPSSYLCHINLTHHVLFYSLFVILFSYFKGSLKL